MDAGRFGQGDDSCPWRMEQEGETFRYSTQSSAQFRAEELFVSGSFPLIFQTAVDRM